MFVVYWHNVLPRSLGEWDQGLPRVTVEAFEKQIAWLTKHFQPLCLADVLSYRDTDCKRGLALTFDDGFQGVYEYGLPILQKYGWTATVFLLGDQAGVSPGLQLMHSELLEIIFRTTHRSHFDQSPLLTESDRLSAYLTAKQQMRPLPTKDRDEFIQEIRTKLDVSVDQIQQFAAANKDTYEKLNLSEHQDLVKEGWSMGAHTLNHPRLTTLTEEEQAQEISAAVEGISSKTFAYPYGDYDQTTAQVVRAHGFEAAFTTDPRPIRPESDPHQLPRMSFGQLWNFAMEFAKRAGKSSQELDA